MDWSEEITAGFPPYNDAEPPNLREQIIAEISDHLNCAYQRELLNTKDEKRAVQSVLEKFGSPKQLARKLWFEEMRGRIVMQKTVLGLLVTMVLGLVVLLFQNVQNSANQQSLLKQNADLILAIQNSSQKTVERWDPFVVQLRGITEDKNLPKFEVRLVNKGFSASKKVAVGDSANFGPLSFGNYTLLVLSPWGEELKREVIGGPRRDQTFIIDCPIQKFAENTVHISTDKAFEEKLVKNNLSFLVVAECDSPDHALVRMKEDSKWKNTRPPRRFTEFVLGTPRHDDKIDRTKILLPEGVNLNILYVGIYDKTAKYLPEFLEEIKGRKSFAVGEIESEYFHTPLRRTLKYKTGYSDHGMPKIFPFQLSYYSPKISQLEEGQSVTIAAGEEPLELKINIPDRFRDVVEKYLEKKTDPKYKDYFSK